MDCDLISEVIFDNLKLDQLDITRTKAPVPGVAWCWFQFAAFVMLPLPYPLIHFINADRVEVLTVFESD